ncbi:glycosyltransferase family 2 protein [Vibrio cholerae]|uniref:glycosyltransferase family 2 protein n=1 Tax=Vibrio cholerae TaxID=666 RepID=UPI0002A1DC96|nr:glycosyltransferase family 2 protein [Vibrio cholerae]EKY32583.1 Putative N-acetylgalactosaminyl-diphosphoundecaprenol glucuronosyltransferase [Vibrio cholerae PS15]
MLISIITPTYNSEKYITETYNSIISQTYTNWEWVVTDDCSTDETFSILSNLSLKDKRVRVFRNSINSGAAISRNNSISKSQGDYLAFIDSDDIWLSTKLEQQLEFMLSKGCSFSFTSYEIIEDNGKRIGKIVDNQHVEYVDYFDMLKKKATLGCSTVMLSKSDFDDLQMPNIRTGQDYALWLKLLKDNKKAYLLGSALTLYRIVPNSISRNKFRKAKRQWQIYREIANLSFYESLFCFCFYAYRACLRK